MSKGLLANNYDAVIVDSDPSVARLIDLHLKVNFGFQNPWHYYFWPGMTAVTPLLPYARLFVVDLVQLHATGPGELPQFLQLTAPKILTSTEGFYGYDKAGYPQAKFLYKPFDINWLFRYLQELGFPRV